MKSCFIHFQKHNGKTSHVFSYTSCMHVLKMLFPGGITTGENGVNQMTEPPQSKIRELKHNASREGVISA